MAKGFGLHIKQAENNQNMAREAAQLGYCDWAVIMCFYAALHYVEAYAAFNGDNIADINELNQHKRTITYVSQIDDTPDQKVFAAYETLYQAAGIARYLKTIRTTSRFDFRNQADQYFNELSVVESFVKAAINPPSS